MPKPTLDQLRNEKTANNLALIQGFEATKSGLQHTLDNAITATLDAQKNLIYLTENNQELLKIFFRELDDIRHLVDQLTVGYYKADD